MNNSIKTLLEQSNIISSWGQSVSPAAYPEALQTLFSLELMQTAQQEIRSWDGYTPSTVHDLTEFAAAAGVHSVYFKDESTRFGLGSFKALGGAYAVMRYLSVALSQISDSAVSMQSIRKGQWKDAAASITVTSATDGNHGRSVAWGAKQAGCNCEIFIHAEVSVGRERAMADLGATVTRIDGDYDESVRACAEAASKNNWQVISDTSYPGYEDVPREVMAGYTMMVAELLEQLPEPPTHIIIQAGVGGLAAAVCAGFWSALNEHMPKIIIVESSYSACVQQSLVNNKPSAVPIENETMMAGLSCGEISLLAWEVLSRCTSLALSIEDTAVPLAMQILGKGLAHNTAIEAGECAVPGLISILAIQQEDALRKQLALDANSRVLVFGCEGATDAELYNSIVQ